MQNIDKTVVTAEEVMWMVHQKAVDQIKKQIPDIMDCTSLWNRCLILFFPFSFIARDGCRTQPHHGYDTDNG